MIWWITQSLLYFSCFCLYQWPVWFAYLLILYFSCFCLYQWPVWFANLLMNLGLLFYLSDNYFLTLTISLDEFGVPSFSHWRVLATIHVPCTVSTYLCVTTSHSNHDHISPVSKYTVCYCSCIINCLHAAKDLSVLKHVMNKYIIIVFPPHCTKNGSVS